MEHFYTYYKLTKIISDFAYMHTHDWYAMPIRCRYQAFLPLKILLLILSSLYLDKVTKNAIASWPHWRATISTTCRWRLDKTISMGIYNTYMMLPPLELIAILAPLLLLLHTLFISLAWYFCLYSPRASTIDRYAMATYIPESAQCEEH